MIGYEKVTVVYILVNGNLEQIMVIDGWDEVSQPPTYGTEDDRKVINKRFLFEFCYRKWGVIVSCDKYPDAVSFENTVLQGK